MSKVDIKDLEKYGMIPEFLGRVPIITTLQSLSKEEMRSILTHALDSPILKYYDFFKAMNKKFSVTDDAIDAIVDKSFEMKMGARSLKSIVENIMVNILYNFDGMKHNTVKLNIKDVENYNIDYEKEFDEVDIEKKTSLGEDSPYLA